MLFPVAMAGQEVTPTSSTRRPCWPKAVVVGLDLPVLRLRVGRVEAPRRVWETQSIPVVTGDVDAITTRVLVVLEDRQQARVQTGLMAPTHIPQRLQRPRLLAAVLVEMGGALAAMGMHRPLVMVVVVEVPGMGTIVLAVEALMAWWY